MMYYTYMHRRADDLLPFYIGKGKGHRAFNTRRRSQRWTRTVAKHGLLIEVLANWETEAEAFEHEKFLIKCFKEAGYGLVNMTDGGDGTSGLTWSDGSKTSFSEIRKTVGITEKNREAIKAGNLTQKSRLNRSNAAKKAMADPTTKALHRLAVSAAKTGTSLSAQRRAECALQIREREKKSVQCVQTGQIFDALVDAAEWLKTTGSPRATGCSVGQAASGRRETAYGFAWKFIEVGHHNG